MCLVIEPIIPDDKLKLERAYTRLNLISDTGASFEKNCREDIVLNSILKRFEHIAEEDVVCYKFFLVPRELGHSRLYCWLHKKRIISPHTYKSYKVGHMYKSDKPIKPDGIALSTWLNRFSQLFYFIRICHGIHAYVKDEGTYQSNMYECIIPKGTKYFLGDSNDIVAEKMFIKRKIR